MTDDAITRRIFVVWWRCNHSRPLAAFSALQPAQEYRDTFKREIDALMKRLALSGDETVLITEISLDAPTPETAVDVDQFAVPKDEPV